MKLVWSLLWVFFHTLALEHFWSNCFAGFCRLDIPIVSGKRHVVSDTHRHERWYHDTRWRHWRFVPHEYFQENYEKVLYLTEMKMTGGKYVVLNLHSIFNVSIKRAITCQGREFLVYVYTCFEKLVIQLVWIGNRFTSIRVRNHAKILHFTCTAMLVLMY